MMLSGEIPLHFDRFLGLRSNQGFFVNNYLIVRISKNEDLNIRSKEILYRDSGQKKILGGFDRGGNSKEHVISRPLFTKFIFFKNRNAKFIHLFN